MGAHLVELDGVSKHFGGVQALRGVSFDIRAGEIHAVVGENGAGKSTLMKLLAGVHAPDSGQLRFDGKALVLRSPADARRLGINVVFQELTLFPDRSVAANIFANREWVDRFGRIRRQAMNEAAREVLSAMDVAIDAETLVGDLSLGEQQLVEIARTLQQQSRLIILDEPNSALTEPESQRLFALVRRMCSQGVAVVYVSHRLEEVFAIADRITVIRDGNYEGTYSTSQTTIPDIVAIMVGRRLDHAVPRRAALSAAAPVALQTFELCGIRFGPVSFDVRAGEIVGFAGLEGSGVDELFSTLFGLLPSLSGQVFYLGQQVRPASPQAAIRLGWGLIPASRRDQGLMMDASIARNTTLIVLDQLLNRLGVVSRSQVQAIAREYMERLKIAGSSAAQPVAQLSGGNQQKVLLAKWLVTKPSLLILNDPTRGVDVGAKFEIYQLCAELAAAGIAVLLTSSELEETLGLADRVLVLRKGQIVGRFESHETTKRQLMQVMAGEAM